MKRKTALLCRLLLPSPSFPSFFSSSSHPPLEVIDTHCHLNMIAKKTKAKWPPTSSPSLGLPSFFTELTREAQEKSERDHHKRINVAGVVHISCSGLLNEIDDVYSIIDDYEKMGVCVGVHPSFAWRYVHGHPDSRNMLLSGEITSSAPISKVEERIREVMKHPKTVGWGECGLDYYKNQPKEFEIQKGVFSRQIVESVRFNKTLVIHCRGDCEKDMLSILHQHLPPTHPTHLHCFSSSPSFLSSLLKSFPNLYIGLTGNITYPSPHSREILQKIPLNRLVLESDGPFLPPEPLPRREVSHGGLLPYVADLVAEVKGVPVEEVVGRTTENARSLYGVKF